MKISSFRVKKFRNIIDSGDIKVDPLVTCLVGKNEAGKSGLLEALYLFNPAYDDKFDVNDQYPRWQVVQDRRAGNLEDQTPISVTFILEESDKTAIHDFFGEGVITGESLTVQKKYEGGTIWSFGWSEEAAIKSLVKEFPESLRPKVKSIKNLKELNNFLDETSSAEDESTGVSPEDVNTVRKFLKGKGLTDKDIWQSIVNILKQELPVFFRFTSYSTLPGRIDFQEVTKATDEGPARSGIQTVRALLELAGTDLSQLGNENYELRKGELEAVQIDLTSQVFEYWKQNPDLEVSIDVDKENVNHSNGTSTVARYLDIRLRDKRTGYSNNFSQRSSGFQWFFSFLAAFSEFEGKKFPIILLDEPALTLHGRAQGDFLRFINERLAPVSSVLYTTHSPFMIEADRLDRVRVVEDNGPPNGAICREDVLTSDPDSLFPLQAALGYDIAQNLFVGPHNLVVEGTSDYIFLTIMSELCSESNREPLDGRWRILPAGGATNIPTFVSLIGPHLDVTVLADSDTRGMQKIKNMIEQKLLSSHRLIMADAVLDSDDADIEDIFSEGDYLKLYNKTFGSSLKLSEIPKGKRIIKRIEAHLKESYNHGKVAETFLRNHHEMTFTETTLNRFSGLIKVINATLSKGQ